MQVEKGEKLFDDWRRNPQPMGFSARLLIKWLSRRCGVSKREAIAALTALPVPEDVDALVSCTFLRVNAAPHDTPASARDAAWGRALRVAALKRSLASAQGDSDGLPSEWSSRGGAVLQHASVPGGLRHRSNCVG